MGHSGIEQGRSRTRFVAQRRAAQETAATNAANKRSAAEDISARQEQFAEDRQSRRAVSGAAGVQRSENDADLLNNRRARRRDAASRDILG